MSPTPITNLAQRELIRLIPRDAATVMEVGAELGADMFQAWNRATRFAATNFAGSIPPAAEHGYDCVTVAEGFARTEHPLEVLRAAGRMLKSGAPLITVMPRLNGGMKDRLRDFLAEADLKLDLARPLAEGDGRYLVRAVARGAPLRSVLIQNMILRPAGGVNDKRVYEPSDFLATIPGVHVVTAINQAVWQPFPPGVLRVLIIQRRLVPRTDASSLRQSARRGYLMITEFDDHPSRWPFIAENDYATFRCAHAVQTSTEILAHELAPYTAEVAVFDNQMASLPLERQLSSTGPVTIFFGAFNRQAEWAPLMPVLQEIIATYGDRLQFQVIHDRDFFLALPTRLKSFTDMCPYDRYLEIMAGCDLTFLPLSDTLFNRCKSDLKFIECAAHQVAVLASPVVYGPSVVEGQTALLFRSAEEFGEKLRFLLNNPVQRIAMANRAREWVANTRLQVQHYRKRYNWYLSLAARKPTLDAIFYSQMDALEAKNRHARSD